jgi:adenylosuccinate synthase
VTSSNASVFGVAAGSGVPPRYINEVIGVTKAYTTRVGEGPFPTELHGELGEQFRERGAEFGATTGRPRRCGWLDAVACRYVSELNGFDSLAITKLDVLSGQKVLRVCVAYEHKGKRIERFPSELGVLSECKPVYEEHRGWTEDITGARKFADLPKAARDYVMEMERLLGAPARIVSVGPEREELIIRS